MTRERRWGRVRIVAVLATAAAAWLPSAPVRADACLQEAWDDGSVQPMALFPNWYRVRVATNVLWMFSGVPGMEQIKGLTVANYGTAVGSDFSAVYVDLECGATNSGFLTLTYAGVYPTDAGAAPAWTWAGTSVDFSGCADLCGVPACGGFFTMNIYTDIAACPTDGATVRMGLPSNGFLGGVTDSQGCHAPTGPSGGAQHTIRYVYKEGPTNAIPGDTIWFTIWYGRPGAGSLTSITILDTLPPYTHYVWGSSTPAPDPGWDPDPGPPSRLRWTIPGSLPTAGGPTGSMSFAVSVDWGNGDAFEPGSGDVAAPEGARIENRASGTFAGALCGYADSAPTQTVVKRFLMWMIGDNDLLFTPSAGQPPDEMIYEVFVKNLSPSKVWWDVAIWDTVPAELDSWCANCGFEDPCTGWTMTPSGCAAATPGRVVAAGKTILTWRLDIQPGATLSLRWKAQVRTNAAVGMTAVNVLSLFERGRSGIAGGTGQSGRPAIFSHLAPIILPITYVSYVAFVASTKGHEKPSLTTFFPLHRKTQFELRSLHYVNDAYANGGGISSSIGCFVGDCIGGFPGSALGCPTLPIVPSPGSLAGCKSERIPAKFQTELTTGYPFQDLYKVTSNAPVAWMITQSDGGQCSDYHMYAPSSSLSYTGLLHYGWRVGYGTTPGGAQGTSWLFMNVGKSPTGVTDTSLETTVHMFQFNYATLSWDYRTTYDLGAESVAMDLGTTLAATGAYRSVSSASQIVVWHGYMAVDTLGCGCPCYNIDTMMPVRETGNVVGFAGQTFYGSTCGSCNPPRAAVGNMGATDATFRVSVYVPDTTTGNAGIPVNLRGSSGSWVFKGMAVVPAGILAALNPRIYTLDGSLFDNPGSSGYKVELLTGGPVQIHHGIKLFSGYGGGAVLNATDGNQTGAEFWVNQTSDYAGTIGQSPPLYSINIFAPKTGMVIQLDTDDGRLETYTTTGPDQSVAFVDFAEPARKRNIRVRRLNTGTLGAVIAEWNSANKENPGVTAPFLQQGVHYTLIAPQVVYSGQSFWMTIVVSEVGGATKLDYCGTTSFTSTDPSAKIEGSSMMSYDFGWSSASGCSAVPDENGVRIFMNMVLTKLGIQTIVAADTIDGSVTGLTSLNVVGADVKLEKSPRLFVAASSDTASFRICWSNYSSASAFTFVISDAVPMGTAFLPEAGTWALNCGGNGATPPLAVAYSTATSPTLPTAASFTQANPVSGARWLRWTVPVVGLNQTGCACFRVTVN